MLPQSAYQNVKKDDGYIVRHHESVVETQQQNLESTQIATPARHVLESVCHVDVSGWSEVQNCMEQDPSRCY